MLRRNEKSTSPSRRPLSPPNPHPRNPLFKSKPENNYPLNNNGIGKESSNSGVASRISQSTSGLNCLMVNSGIDNNGSLANKTIMHNEAFDENSRLKDRIKLWRFTDKFTELNINSFELGANHYLSIFFQAS